MSGRLQGEVFWIILPRQEKEVLRALANFANDDGTNARPGLPRLADMVELSQRQAQRYLRALEARGLIEAVEYKTGGTKHPTNYTIHIERAIFRPERAKYIPKGDTPRTPVSPFQAIPIETKGDTPRTPVSPFVSIPSSSPKSNI
jgi:hypothetical protein